MRKSYKTPEQVEAIMIELYGTVYGNQGDFATKIGKHEVSLSRYLNGKQPVDKTTANLMDKLVEEHRRKQKRGTAKPATTVSNFGDML